MAKRAYWRVSKTGKLFGASVLLWLLGEAMQQNDDRRDDDIDDDDDDIDDDVYDPRWR